MSRRDPPSKTRIAKIRFHVESDDPEIEVWVRVDIHRGRKVETRVNCIGHITPSKMRNGSSLFRVRLDGLGRAIIFKSEIAARRYVLHKFNEVVNTKEDFEAQQEGVD